MAKKTTKKKAAPKTAKGKGKGKSNKMPSEGSIVNFFC
jgi:hypothetical protein